MKTAGRAVSASGITVAISLLALLIVPVPALRSMGLAGIVDPDRERGRGPDSAARPVVEHRTAHRLPPHPKGSGPPRVGGPHGARQVVGHRAVATAVAVTLLALLISRSSA
jgi:RND superfamily putative drug exporter